MAVMNDRQNELLKKLEGARVTYDSFEEALAQRVADEKWERKTEIRELVREARDAGVPYRQIGFALQTSDHNTLKQYEKDIRR